MSNLYVEAGVSMVVNLKQLTVAKVKTGIINRLISMLFVVQWTLSSISEAPSTVNPRKSRSTRDSLRKMADRRRRRRNTSTSDSDHSEDESIPSLNSNARVPRDSECVSSNLSKLLNLNSENYQLTTETIWGMVINIVVTQASSRWRVRIDLDFELKGCISLSLCTIP